MSTQTIPFIILAYLIVERNTEGTIRQLFKLLGLFAGVHFLEPSYLPATLTPLIRSPSR